MSILIKNNKPVALSTTQFEPPLEDAAAGGSDYNLHEIITTILSDHIIKSTHKGVPVIATDDQGTNRSVSDLAEIIVDAFNPDHTDLGNESEANVVLAQLTGLVDTSHELSPREAFVSQRLTQLRQPAASNRVIYSAYRDVIQCALDYKSHIKSGKIDAANTEMQRFFANVASVYSPPTLGVAFANADAFERFKAAFDTACQNYQAQNLVSASEAAKMRKFTNLTLNDALTESLLLRTSMSDPTESYSFARVLIHTLHHFIMDDSRNQAMAHKAIEAEWMPFDMSQWLIPEAIVFANVDNHASATPKQVDEEWESINAALYGGLKIMSPHSITKLTTAHNQLQKAASQAIRAQKRSKDEDKIRDVTESAFTTSPPSSEAIMRDFMEVMKRCANVNKSQNTQRFVTKSIHKQSRRQPDNPNVPGRTHAKHYYPDVHIYADTSGSISIEQYQTTAFLIMQLAKKLDFNIYFSSFSHLLSHEVLMPVKGKTEAQLIKMVEVIPKVTGWTDYYQFWDYIAASEERKQRLNLIITDFEFEADSYRKAEVSPYTFYAPTVGNSQWQWDSIRRSTANFCNSMKRHDPTTFSRILGMRV